MFVCVVSYCSVHNYIWFCFVTTDKYFFVTKMTVSILNSQAIFAHITAGTWLHQTCAVAFTVTQKLNYIKLINADVMCLDKRHLHALWHTQLTKCIGPQTHTVCVAATKFQHSATMRRTLCRHFASCIVSYLIVLEMWPWPLTFYHDNIGWYHLSHAHVHY